MRGMNPRDFTAGGIKHWEPSEDWAIATGAVEDVGYPAEHPVYPSGIRNESANKRGLEYITSKDYAEGLMAARRQGWDGIDYTDNRVAELKHRMHASIRHDKMLAEAKRNRIAAIREAAQPAPQEDASAWDFDADPNASQPAKLRQY